MIPIHTRKISRKMRRKLDTIPEGFKGDGMSGFPDSILGWSLFESSKIHDFRYCGRCHPKTEMTKAKLRDADCELADNVDYQMPTGLNWLVSRIVYGGVRIGGWVSYDTCGEQPVGVSLSQNAAGLCRHDIPWGYVPWSFVG